ncbi:MAG TPA: hydrogenase maturation protease [Candidatus Sulfotelmatobacter sp.]|nr:hydrogenase maturation protease [Candidatus Sulfotelmatobacter sp.]HWI57166.1 hydrogenase maturation protease [Bacillota bacterium]
MIIGLGNEYRHDDAVGLFVAQQLQGRSLAGVTVLAHSGEGVDLLEVWPGHMTVFLVDAVCSEAPAGTIHRLDAGAGPIPSRFFHCSTHAFNVAEAIELARALQQLPPYLRLYGIEGKDYSAGVRLSAEVEQAAVAVTRELLGCVCNAKQVTPLQG